MSIIMSFNKTELETTTNSLIGETPNVTNIRGEKRNGHSTKIITTYKQKESNKLEFSATKFLRKAIYFKTSILKNTCDIINGDFLKNR